MSSDTDDTGGGARDAGSTADPYRLQRFLEVQDAGTYERALAELRAGRKRSHWMWFVFPQLAGLGRSSTAQQFGIGGLQEARALLAHPVLGPRLREAATAVLQARGTAVSVLGEVDALKLRSSATLFLRAAPDEDVWQQVLDRFHDGEADPLTDALLEGRLSGR